MFTSATTSLRLLMFQVYFLSAIGRPSGTKGSFDVLGRYEKQLSKPITAQKEDLRRNAKAILAASTWVQFFKRLGGPVPSCPRLWLTVEEKVIIYRHVWMDGRRIMKASKKHPGVTWVTSAEKKKRAQQRLARGNKVKQRCR